jgi:DNA-directed RNA polymerase beta subunit
MASCNPFLLRGVDVLSSSLSDADYYGADDKRADWDDPVDNADDAVDTSDDDVSTSSPIMPVINPVSLPPALVLPVPINNRSINPAVISKPVSPVSPTPLLSVSTKRGVPRMRSFGDVSAARAAIFDSVQRAASTLPPVENQRYALTLRDVSYAKDVDTSPDAVKRLVMERGTLSRTLRGTWEVYDKTTGNSTYRTTVVAKVPYLLDNGTFLREGTKYIMRNQSRLLPGMYTRRRDNGELETHVNTDVREGAIHHYGLDPSTGQLNVLVGGTKTPLYGLAKILGATDEELETAWGKDLHVINKNAYKEAHIDKLHGKLMRGVSTAVDADGKSKELRTALERISFNPDVMELTLGKPYTHLNKDVLLDATRKLLAVSRGEAEGDDRDNMSFQEIYGPEDIFAERVARDGGNSRRQLLNMLTYRYKGDAAKIPAGILTKQLDAAILNSGLGGNPEEINPLEVLDKGYSVTKLGVGGVPSRDAVPDESRSLHPSHRGFMDPARTPESDNVGVETYVATAALKGEDRQLYAPVWDTNGKEHLLRPKDIYTKTIAMESEYKRAGDNDYIAASSYGKERLVKKKDVDYTIPHFEAAFSPLANLVPFKSATQGNRVCMGSRMFQQAVPLVQGEAPLVQTGVPGKPDRSYYEEYSNRAGALYADVSGTVTEATDDHITVLAADGTKRRVDMYRNFPSNRKTSLTNTPVVAIGQQIKKGDLLARSNATDANGTIAVGANARVIMVPWKGLNFEDGFIVSESFAKKMTSEHMYQNSLDWTKEHRKGRHAFMGIFPSTFNKQQLDVMDDAGVVLPGTTVKQGDPLVLAARETDPNGKRKKRRLYSDVSVKWDHEDDGVVTDVYNSDKGVVVLVKTQSAIREGDKIANRFGNKGVVTVLPDDDMPRTADGMVAEVVLSPAATVSRGNPAQLAELALGKIAAATGKVYKVTDFEDIDDIPAFVDAELRKHGIDPDSPLIDPKTGEKIYNEDGTGVANGSMWFMRLHHTAEGKGSARGLGGYDAGESPARGGDTGSKRMAQMHLNALVSHGAYNTFMDAKYNRGQANDDFWMQYMQGGNPQTRKIPLVYEKFENSLRAAGINVRPSKDRLHIMAMTDKDVSDLAGGREVRSGDTVRWEKDKTPIGGGLFDPVLFGMDGSRWGQITPAVPVLNPVMEEPTRILLGLKQAELKAVLQGDKELGKHGTGIKAVQRALGDISVPLAINNYRGLIDKGNISQRDTAVRALSYLKGCQTADIHPKDWVLNKLPVLPPRFRPVSEMQGSKVPLVDDANYLYKIMIDTNNSLKDLQKITTRTHKDEYNLYEAYKQVTGLADPTHPKLVQRQVRGLLQHVFGAGSSKFSMVQRSLLGVPTDTVARGVIVSDPDLDIDSVGIPEDKAWEIYRPHLVHQLTKRGTPWALAAKAIEERTDLARDALMREMEQRPVLLDRAPVLHKWGIQAFKPRLVKGDSIHLNAFVEKGYGADFDGDAMNVSVPYSKEAIDEAYELLLPSKSLIKASDMKGAMHRLTSENAAGLYLASLPPNKNKKTRTFATWADAKRAYRDGELGVDDPVVVLNNK